MRSDEYELSQSIIWEQDTGNIRYEYEWTNTDNSYDDCCSQPDRSSVVRDEEEREEFYDDYKDWLREQDVEEGLLQW